MVCLSALKLISVSVGPSSYHPLLDQTPSQSTASKINETEEYPVINEKEVYATFLSTRVGSNMIEGESDHDWYYISTRVLIHRLLRNPATRGRRRVVVLSHWKKILTAGARYRERCSVETRPS